MIKSNMETLMLLLLLSGLWALGTVIYRLFFHPLAKIPGPKIAAATSLYEWYYDIALGGQYTFKLKKLHMEYGEKKSCWHFVRD
jgi:hypothetical protein